MPGVERRMLDRVGAEVARASTIVRHAPESRFSAHTHDGGEGFIVLEGVFRDEHGDFPAGSHVRDPPTSSHTPGAAQGCVIFVKLWQFDPDDRAGVRIDTAAAEPVPAPGRPGVATIALHADAREAVRIGTWAPAARIVLDAPGGFEALVIAGGFAEGGEGFAPQSWLRLPAGARLDAVAGPQGARVWVKTGHLAAVQASPAVA